MTNGRCVIDLAGLSAEEVLGGSPKMWLHNGMDFHFVRRPEDVIDGMISLQQLHAVAVRFGDPRINRILEVLWNARKGYPLAPDQLDVIVSLPSLFVRLQAVPRSKQANGNPVAYSLTWSRCDHRCVSDAESVLQADHGRPVQLALDDFILTAADHAPFEHRFEGRGVGVREEAA